MTSPQVALITGSSRGIGLGIACELARKNYSIALNAPFLDEELEAAIAKVQNLGVPVIAAAFDVTDFDRHTEFLSDIESQLGPLTTLVNNAGVSVLQRGDLLAVSPESFDRCMSVNAKAVFFLSQAFSKKTLGREINPDIFHSIINVTSSNAVAAATLRSEYCASKAAAAMISKTLAVRLGSEGIHVYDVQPGLIDTDMTAGVIKEYEKELRRV